jgi:hypothetical protein
LNWPAAAGQFNRALSAGFLPGCYGSFATTALTLAASEDGSGE